MDTKEMQKEVDIWVSDKGGYWHPLSQLARLNEEQGELARELNNVYGEKKKRLEESIKSIEEEVGDVLFTLLCIANSQKIDLETAYIKTLQKYNIRDKDRFK